MTITLKTNTYLNNTSTRKAIMSVDKNGHYTVKKFSLSELERVGWNTIPSVRTYKKVESAQRACEKWIKS